MNRTITALFDSRDDAERASARLKSCGVSAVHITAQGQGYGDDLATGTSTATATAGGVGHGAGTTTAAEPVTEVTAGTYPDSDDRRGGGGLWGAIKNMFSDADRYTYEEGLRRGHFLLTAQVDDDRADEAVRILEDSDAVDVDRRVEEWRSAGWTGGASRSSDDHLQGITGDDTLRGTSGDDQLRATEATSDRLQTEGAEQTLPIIEETLKVGKREVGRGGVRVRSYIVEEPVSEQVSLREEHVNVERRAVDQPLSSAQGDIFQERTIELTETAEEVVVAKEARVTEELVINKDVEQRTETVSDTVRHTEVDVERLAGETDEAYRARAARGAGAGTSSTL